MDLELQNSPEVIEMMAGVIQRFGLNLEIDRSGRVPILKGDPDEIESLFDVVRDN